MRITTEIKVTGWAHCGLVSRQLLILLKIVKRILTYILIPFVVLPPVYAWIVYLLNGVMPAQKDPVNPFKTPMANGDFIRYVWSNLFAYYAIIFLLVVLAVYAFISYFFLRATGKRLPLFARWPLLLVLQLFSMALTNLFTLFFANGHTTLKWILFALIASALCAAIPPSWLHGGLQQKDDNALNQQP